MCFEDCFSTLWGHRFLPSTEGVDGSQTLDDSGDCFWKRIAEWQIVVDDTWGDVSI
jgi:hypothetical protein